MTQQEHDDQKTLISQVIDLTLKLGKFNNGKYEIYLTDGSYDVKVRDCLTNNVVAYSSTKADFENSLVEFATDYFS